MTETEAYQILEPNINEYPNDSSQVVEIKKMQTTLPNDDVFFVIKFDKNDNPPIGRFDFYLARIRNREALYYFFVFLCPSVFDQDGIFPYDGTILSKQIGKFRYKNTSAFFYDFNHDGNEKLLGFRTSGQGIGYLMITFDYINNRRESILQVIVPLPSDIPVFEFVIYKGRRGIKIYDYIDGLNWQFYYYDRAQRRYVEDKSASNEELEKIQGSPDFFAEAGIDYRKLERRLSAEDLEGFSKAALRIWRNAVYARRGRRFESEDLQALFSEYEWYKLDEEYGDEKLTETDLWNIKLIQEYERK